MPEVFLVPLRRVVLVSQPSASNLRIEVRTVLEPAPI